MTIRAGDPNNTLRALVDTASYHARAFELLRPHVDKAVADAAEDEAWKALKESRRTVLQRRPGTSS